jgi:NIMA-interacting peptidyl-prolyl cis-trans isomerase 1
MSVRASHLLVKHNESRNPVSRRTNAAVTKSKAEAHKEIEQVLKELTPANFAAQAKALSDCSSFAKGGDLGVFGRGTMQKPFEDATYALGVGEMSGIVSTDSGLHVILRTA